MIQRDARTVRREIQFDERHALMVALVKEVRLLDDAKEGVNTPIKDELITTMNDRLNRYLIEINHVQV